MNWSRSRRLLLRSISTSKKVNKLTPAGALLFTWLCLHCDDHGRMQGDPFTVRITVVPGLKDYTDELVSDLLMQMAKVGLIIWYEINDEKYLEINGWVESQSWDRIVQQESSLPSFDNDCQLLATVDNDCADMTHKLSKDKKDKKVKIRYCQGEPVYDLVTRYFDIVGKRGARGMAQDKIAAHLKAGIPLDDLTVAVDNCAEYHRLAGTEDRHKMLAQTFFYRGWEDARWWPEVTRPESTTDNVYTSDDIQRGRAIIEQARFKSIE